jgi:tetratricopeptide (TPR) repeat protein
MCYQRLGQNGDAVDRWEEVTGIDPTSAIAEKAWTRAGDVYFTTGHYDKARYCYEACFRTSARAAAPRSACCAWRSATTTPAATRSPSSRFRK